MLDKLSEALNNKSPEELVELSEADSPFFIKSAGDNSL